MEIKERSFIIKGNICYSKNKDEILTFPNSYVICKEGKSVGVFDNIPKEYAMYPILDYKDQMVLPGLVDLHIHAPQYAYRGLGMDLELLEWLNQIAFPEEAKYADIAYAAKAYETFVSDIRQGATTRLVVFGTLHTKATEVLMELLETSGLIAYVGKVNMDRNSPDILREESAEISAAQTLDWIKRTYQYSNVKPIITPRFIPSCTDTLMKKLAELIEAYELPLQSHLSENPSEIEWVKELCPDSTGYGDAYFRRNLFGGNTKTVMAHCVYWDRDELELIKRQLVFIAHCPQSNTNLASGIAPLRTYLRNDLKVGLGSDVAGGFSSSIFRAMTDAIQMSKLRWRLIDQELEPLTVPEAFYLGTIGGGEFFGQVGSFEAGYEFDAIIIDDSYLKTPLSLSLSQRLERILYLVEERKVVSKFVAGKQLF